MAGEKYSESSDRKTTIETHTRIVSESIRKIVVTLMLTVFGLAYEDKTFVFDSLRLKISIILFVSYFAIDMLQHIGNVWVVLKYRKNNLNTEFLIFILKLLPALAGLILILFEIIAR